MRALACIVLAILAANVGLGVQRAVYDAANRWLSRVQVPAASYTTTSPVQIDGGVTTWSDDCNTCTYLGDGVASCTLMACDVTPALIYGGTTP